MQRLDPRKLHLSKLHIQVGKPQTNQIILNDSTILFLNPPPPIRGYKMKKVMISEGHHFTSFPTAANWKEFNLLFHVTSNHNFQNHIFVHSLAYATIASSYILHEHVMMHVVFLVMLHALGGNTWVFAESRKEIMELLFLV